MTNELLLKFLIGVPGTLLIYYLLPRRGQNYWLLLVSYVFYVSYEVYFGLTLAAVTLITYFIAHRIEAAEGGGRVWLWAGIAANVLIMLAWKYLAVWLPAGLWPPVQRGLALMMRTTASTAGNILMPLGLSFVMLQQISYLFDVSRGQLAASRDLVDFSLYTAYFPKLIAGPLERACDFIPKLATPRTVKNEQVIRGFTLVMLGIFRKVIVADPLNTMLPTDLFSQPGAYSGGALLVWLLIYGIALYNDFAGYTNIVRGISTWIGIELSANFRQPYFARNFTEFWNRWHITFTYWLRDYIFMPVTRAMLRRSRGRRNVWNASLPPLLTMLISGLWHTISLPLLLWGLLHGIYQVAERLAALGKPVTPPDQWPLWRQMVGMAGVTSLAMLAVIPFGATDISAVGAYLVGLVQWPGGFLIPYRALWLIIPALCLDIIQYRGGELTMTEWPLLARSAALALILLMLLAVLRAEVELTPFIYQGF